MDPAHAWPLCAAPSPRQPQENLIYLSGIGLGIHFNSFPGPLMSSQGGELLLYIMSLDDRSLLTGFGFVDRLSSLKTLLSFLLTWSLPLIFRPLLCCSGIYPGTFVPSDLPSSGDTYRQLQD